MVTRVPTYLGGLGIDATNKFVVAANATVTVGNGTTTGNVNAGLFTGNHSGDGGGLNTLNAANVVGNLPTTTKIYISPNNDNTKFKIPFANTASSGFGNFDLLYDNTATFTYNPYTDTLELAKINATSNIVIAGTDVIANDYSTYLSAMSNDFTTYQAALSNDYVTYTTLVPTGSIIMYGGSSNTQPSGWLYCNSQAVSRSTYSALFAVTSTFFGVGDNSTTFNVPDFGGRSPFGANTIANGLAFGYTSTGRLDTAATYSGASDGPTTHSVTTSTTNSTTDKDVTNSITVLIGVSNHASHTHTITPPAVAVRFMIKT